MADQVKTTKPAGQVQVADKNDVEKNKVFAVLAYFGLLCLLPILAAKDSKYAMFHGNQGLVLLIAEVILGFSWVFLLFIPVIGWLIGFAAWVLILVLAIMGIVSAANGEMKPLPVIGEIKILK